MSGNNIGASIYSDGKQIAPMFPEYPYLCKCQICKSFYWLNDKTEIDLTNISDNIHQYSARFLKIDEYFEALQVMNSLDSSHERFMRFQIYWLFNDRIRSGKEIFSNEEDEVLYISNIQFLLELLDENEIEDQITQAEVYRNMGLFDDAIRYLNQIDNKNYQWVIDRIKEKALAGEKEVFLLNP